MSTTTRIPLERLAAYLDGFTRSFLTGLRPRAVDVEHLESELGDQYPVAGARLTGISYDAHSHALEIALDIGDHRVRNPREVWAIEEPDGFVSVIEVVCANGSREIVRVTRVGLRRLN
ncbi:MAG TPA: DUF5335 family protein [Longimicrobium sp.]|jgi:hypothetical protein|nr:DUF5335 family protein [Longimicrobium sp.]